MALFDKDAITRDLDTYNGNGPMGSMNPAAGDGYFALSLLKKWGMTMGELEKIVDYRGVAQRRKRAQEAYDAAMDDGADDEQDEQDERHRGMYPYHRAIKLRR